MYLTAPKTSYLQDENVNILITEAYIRYCLKISLTNGIDRMMVEMIRFEFVQFY